MTIDKRDPIDARLGLDPEDKPGYAEEHPDSRKDAQQPGPGTGKDPDDGGLGREPDAQADPAED